MTKKIYFAGSIRGGRDDVELYSKIILHLRKYGLVLTEHIGSDKLHSDGESLTDKYIHDRDIDWVIQSDIIVAEVSTPSLGVGYEIGRAVENNKKILCLYRLHSDKKVSAMISGSPDLVLKNYSDIDEAKLIIDEFFSKL